MMAKCQMKPGCKGEAEYFWDEHLEFGICACEKCVRAEMARQYNDFTQVPYWLGITMFFALIVLAPALACAWFLLPFFGVLR